MAERLAGDLPQRVEESRQAEAFLVARPGAALGEAVGIEQDAVPCGEARGVPRPVGAGRDAERRRDSPRARRSSRPSRRSGGMAGARPDELVAVGRDLTRTRWRMPPRSPARRARSRSARRSPCRTRPCRSGGGRATTRGVRPPAMRIRGRGRRRRRSSGRACRRRAETRRRSRLRGASWSRRVGRGCRGGRRAAGHRPSAAANAGSGSRDRGARARPGAARAASRPRSRAPLPHALPPSCVADVRRDPAMRTG